MAGAERHCEHCVSFIVWLRLCRETCRALGRSKRGEACAKPQKSSRAKPITAMERPSDVAGRLPSPLPIPRPFPKMFRANLKRALAPATRSLSTAAPVRLDLPASESSRIADRPSCESQTVARPAFSNAAAGAAAAVSLGTLAWYSHLYGNPLLAEAKAESAADHGLHPTAMPWSHNGPFETFDHAA